MIDLSTVQRPSLGRYLACLMYESLLVLAWLFILVSVWMVLKAAVLHHMPGGRLEVASGLELLLLRLWILVCLGAYFALFWMRGGQTLAMKTWKLRLVSLGGGRVSFLQSAARFLTALMGIPLLGITWLWAFGSPQRLWLHDQLSRTVLIVQPNSAALLPPDENSGDDNEQGGRQQ